MSDKYKKISGLLKNRAALLEFIKDDLHQSDDVAAAASLISNFYDSLIDLECAAILEKSNSVAHDVSDDFSEDDHV